MNKVNNYKISFTFENRFQAIAFISYCNTHKIRCKPTIYGNRTVFFDGTYKQAIDFKKNNKETK